MLPRLHLSPKSRVFGPKTARSPLYPLLPARQNAGPPAAPYGPTPGRASAARACRARRSLGCPPPASWGCRRSAASSRPGPEELRAARGAGCGARRRATQAAAAALPPTGGPGVAAWGRPAGGRGGSGWTPGTTWLIALLLRSSWARVSRRRHRRHRRLRPPRRPTNHRGGLARPRLREAPLRSAGGGGTANSAGAPLPGWSRPRPLGDFAGNLGSPRFAFRRRPPRGVSRRLRSFVPRECEQHPRPPDRGPAVAPDPSLSLSAPGAWSTPIHPCPPHLLLGVEPLDSCLSPSFDELC